MADFIVGKKRKYTCVPKDDAGNPAAVDLSVAPAWAVDGDTAFISLEPDPDGNPLVQIGTALAEGDTNIFCTVDADRGAGMVTLVISSKVQHVVGLSATHGDIDEEDL